MLRRSPRLIFEVVGQSRNDVLTREALIPARSIEQINSQNLIVIFPASARGSRHARTPLPATRSQSRMSQRSSERPKRIGPAKPPS
jgi:hypothetical protein